eukprot:gnl/TRDRNA2_/TRDRNA2_175680_c1_seq4.p1 gnl/TRDRNA2_/TRDRNA2_175680_c1~~gnl/TRDRNA2_/TRDRNA2_175680_c1_seq4.p1  ORF type:complete len:111 (+),score=5.00 gnl/TRDRNA2_/TRDRNA2_175680_c1_seq4:128-460(+)
MLLRPGWENKFVHCHLCEGHTLPVHSFVLASIVVSQIRATTFDVHGSITEFTGILLHVMALQSRACTFNCISSTKNKSNVSLSIAAFACVGASAAFSCLYIMITLLRVIA